jgi:dolichol kinase
MLAIFACLVGVFAILVIGELLGQQKILRGDPQRKLIHIIVGCFIAFWPWFISWKAIAWIGVAMLAVVLLNHRVKLIDFHSSINRNTYGDIFFALAIIAAALITDDKIFFALAILIMSIGDSAANLIGQKYGGKQWRYKVFNHTKTVIGTMAMWFTSICILGVGLLFAHDLVSFSAYATLILVLPPILVVAENIGLLGADNLLVPLVVLLALNLAS